MEAVRPEVERKGGVDAGCPAETAGVVEEMTEGEVEGCLVGYEEEEKAEGASAAVARGSAHVGSVVEAGRALGSAKGLEEAGLDQAKAAVGAVNAGWEAAARAVD